LSISYEIASPLHKTYFLSLFIFGRLTCHFFIRAQPEWGWVCVGVVVSPPEVKRMDAKAELEGCYLRLHPSERELDKYEQEYLESCVIPEMEEGAVRKVEDYLPGPKPVARVLSGLSSEYTIKIKTDREAGQRIIQELQKLDIEVSDPFNKLGGRYG